MMFRIISDRRPAVIAIAACLGLLVLVLALAAGRAAAASSDPFTGAWITPDTDGDIQSVEIGAPSNTGVRTVTLFDPAANVCNRASANAIGTGTVAGQTLTATLKVLCHGTVVFVGSFYFTVSGNTLVSDTAVFPYVRR